MDELMLLLFVTLLLVHGTTLNFLVTDDPSLFPGHMEPLGAHQVKEDIEILLEYPTPQDFFTKYVRAGRPFLLKHGAKHQRAYKYWNDAYMKSFPQSATEMVDVEPNHKESREAKGFSVPLQEFLERYHKEYFYMVNKVPSFLQKDVMMPTPLMCDNTREMMLDHVVWMSAGGTKSVLHNDDLDNINCLFRGSKYLLLINPDKYNGKVPIDQPEGGYSSLDVEKVNFTKYPSLREVSYIQCHMEEGDCLFIPWRWYHQVNSIANKDHLNIAVNIWFEHRPLHEPQTCELPDPRNGTLDHFHFKGMGSLFSTEEGEKVEYPLLSLYEFTLSRTKYNRANINTFHSILQKIPGIFVETPIHDLHMTERFKEHALQMFDKLNANNDKYISKEDFDAIFDDDEIADELETWLESEMLLMREEVEAQLKDTPHESTGDTLHHSGGTTETNSPTMEKDEL